MSVGQPQPAEGTTLEVAFLTSVYPAVSTTFIFNEIAGLAARSIRVIPFAIRRPAPDQLTQSLRKEITGVHYILPPPIGRTAATVFVSLARRPLRFVSTLLWALARPLPLKRRLMLAVYFVEGLLLARELERRGIAHLHVHHANNAATVALLAHRYCGLAYSITAHGSDILVENELLPEKIRATRFVVTISEFNRDHLIAAGAPADRVHLVGTGVDLGRFHPPGERAAPAGDALRMLSVGRYDRVKGYDLLIAACARLRDDGVSFRCDIVGEGPERDALEAQIDGANLGDVVHLRGLVGPEDLPTLYRDADLFVSSSRSEGIPVVAMEAMASSLPVVAPRITGVPELVDERSGVLVEPSDPDALAGAISALANDEQKRRTMGEAGREAVARDYDLNANLDRLALLFRRKIGEGSTDAVAR